MFFFFFSFIVYFLGGRSHHLLPPVYSSECVLSIADASLPLFQNKFQPVLSLLHNYPVSRHFSVLLLNMAWLHASQLLPRLCGCRDHTSQHQWWRHHGDIPGASEADIPKYEVPRVQLEAGVLDIKTTCPQLQSVFDVLEPRGFCSGFSTFFGVLYLQF